MIEQLIAAAIVAAYFLAAGLVYWGLCRFMGAPLGRRLDNYMTDLIGVNDDGR